MLTTFQIPDFLNKEYEISVCSSNTVIKDRYMTIQTVMKYTTLRLVDPTNPPRDHPRASPENICKLITISRATPTASVSR
jgi:hypothetical protein